MVTLEEVHAMARARRDRAEATSGLLLSAARALWNGVRKLDRAWMTHRARAELHALSDRTLKDIGLSRGEIDALFR